MRSLVLLYINFITTVYGFVNESAGRYSKQALIHADEGTTVNLTIFYWKGIQSNLNFHKFDWKMNSTAGIHLKTL